MKRKTWFLLLLGVFLAVAGTIAFVTGVGPYDLPRQSRKLEQVLAESKRLGLPMTQAELESNQPKPETNAAPDLMRLFPVNYDFPSLDGLDAENGTDPKLLPKSLLVLKEIDNQLDQAAAVIATKTDWFVDRDYDLGPFWMAPEFATLKYMSKFFCLRSDVRAQKGDWQGAISDFQSALRLGRLVSKDASYIGLLVSIAIDAIALRQLEKLVVNCHDVLLTLRALEAIVTAAHHRLDPEECFRNEFYMSIVVTRNLKLFGGIQELASSGFIDTGLEERRIDPTKIRRDGLPSGLLARASLTTMAEFWNECIRQLHKTDKPYRDFGRIFEAEDAKINDFTLSRTLYQILTPTFGPFEEALKRNDVQQDMALAFVRAFIFRAAHHRWPKGLAEIKSEVPDPFAPGKSVKFLFTEKSARIWSIGPNGIDEQGVFGEIGLDGSKLSPRADDIALAWPYPLIPAK